MENQSFKKSLFGGFKREEVLEYVDGMSTQYQQEIENLNIELRRSAAEKAQLEADLDDLKHQLQKQQEQIEKLEQVLCKQKTDNDRLQELNIAVDKNAKEVHAQNVELGRQLNQAREELEQKTARLEQIEEVGFNAEKVMAEANSRATTVLADANNRAASMLTDAGKQSRESVENARKKAEEIVAKATEEADHLRLAAQDFNQQSKRKMDDLAAELNDKEKKANIKASQILREAQEEAEQILKTARKRAKLANDRYETFTDDVAEVKQSILKLLQEVEIKINQVDENLPAALFVEDVLSGEQIPEKASVSEKQTSASSSAEFFR